MIRTAEQAAEYLTGLINLERDPSIAYERLGLEPIFALLARLGNPERSLSVIHIAGSKGKGSVALFCEAILRALGERVGTFTSPHLESWTERFRVDGEPVSGTKLAAAVNALRPHVDALRAERPDLAPTFFDATTAVAFLLFRDARVDRVVLETGLGGRLDSTNVVDPAVTCISSIELEHTDKLGTTLAAIAGEKAGIVKSKRPVVIGALAEEARKVVIERAESRAAPTFEIGREIRFDLRSESMEGLDVVVEFDGERTPLKIPVLGRHQAENAALAMACVAQLSPEHAKRMGEGAARGFATVRLPGRIEVLERKPCVVVDSAHTMASARGLAEALRLIPRRRTRLVLSVSADKQLAAFLAEILPGVDEAYVTRADSIRSLAAPAVATAVAKAAPGIAVHAVPNPFQALRAALEGAGDDDLVCVTGSVYLAGIARRVIAGNAWRASRNPPPPTPSR